ncbi:hypothetical protein HK099_001052, partial [Clydaea vesicula]
MYTRWYCPKFSEELKQEKLVDSKILHYETKDHRLLNIVNLEIKDNIGNENSTLKPTILDLISAATLTTLSTSPKNNPISDSHSLPITKVLEFSNTSTNDNTHSNPSKISHFNSDRNNVSYDNPVPNTLSTKNIYDPNYSTENYPLYINFDTDYHHQFNNPTITEDTLNNNTSTETKKKKLKNSSNTHSVRGTISSKACEKCRLKKRKCDGKVGNPCTKCVKENIECVYNQVSGKRGPKLYLKNGDSTNDSISPKKESNAVIYSNNSQIESDFINEDNQVLKASNNSKYPNFNSIYNTVNLFVDKEDFNKNFQHVNPSPDSKPKNLSR